MKCYQCGSQLSNDDFCPKCGADVTIYKTVVKASDTYYNLGLAKAQVRDLSGAVESLKTSLSINKNNVKARNLLGLVLLEMGNVVEALSEWVVSKNQKPDKNIAGTYITKIQSNQTKFENATSNIRKYNQSLHYAQEGSTDLATIQLKKIVASSPKLLKAQLLLAVLYIKEKEYNRAKKCLNAVLNIDHNNTLAKMYTQEIELIESQKLEDVSDSFMPKRKAKNNAETKPLSGNDVIMPIGSYKEPSNGAITIINILLGVLVGAAMVWFLIIPSKYKGLTDDYNKSLLEYSEKLSSGNVELNSLQSQLDAVTAERDSLTTKLDSVSGAGGSNKMLDAVIASANAYIANDRTTAATSLIDVDVSSLPTDNAKNLYNTIAAATMEAASNELYNQGNNLYYQSKYQEAADILVKAFKLNSTKVEAAYYAARSYMGLNNTEEAKKYYQIIIDSFATSQYVGEARTYVQSH